MKVVKYFSATWCGPCKQFKPIMEEIANEGYSVMFIDVDEEENTATKYVVRSVPTVVIEENGIEIDRFIGVLPKKQVIERLSP
jgi:thioredoxin 1|tara:strand:+ start:2273 stop:2521 length:249 start_codon:yes stop_codon:yes gene_type:complete